MALTWRNVDAPNLAGAAQVIGENGQRFSQSLNDLAAGLGQFGQARTDRADAAAIQAASQITNSADYAKALADGSILRNAGIDPNMVSGKVSALLADRQNVLLQNDYQQAQIKNQQQDNQMARDRFTFEKSQAEKEGIRTNYRFGREQTADQRADTQYADAQTAQQMVYDLSQMGVDAAGARDYLAKSGASDKVQAMVSKALGIPTGGILPTAPKVGGFAGANAVYAHGAHLVPDFKLTEGNFGQAYDFGQKQIQATKGKLKDKNGQVLKDSDGNLLGTSAVGAYQMIGTTMQDYAEKVLGKDWRNQPFTFENQSKIAEALFNDNKNGNLQAVWEGIPDARPGAYKNMSFEEFQREVLSRESGRTLDQIRQEEQEAQRQATVNQVAQSLTETKATVLGIEGNAAQRLGSIKLDDYFRDSRDNDTDISRAAEAAIKTYPSLKGTDLNKVIGWLDTIQQESAANDISMTPMQATHILGASMTPSMGITSVVADMWRPNAESGLYFDSDKMGRVLRQVNQGDPLGRELVSTQIRNDIQQANNAAAALQAAFEHNQKIQDAVAQNIPVSDKVKNDAATALAKALKQNERFNAQNRDPSRQQKLIKSDAEIAREEAAKKSKVAQAFAPVPNGTAAGIGYAPATSITTGLPSQASLLIEKRVSR